MESKAVTRRKFLGRTSAAVGLGVLSHPSFSARVFGANDRVVMGIIGSGGMGRGHMGRFGSRGADWAAVADVYEVNRDAALEIAGGKATGYFDHRKLLERKDIDAVLIASPREWP